MTANEALQNAVDIIKKYDCRSIVLFGSRARNTHNDRSDIDIAVDCSADELEKIKNDIEHIPTLRKFDLININDISADLKKEIEKYGRVLYGKD